MSEDRERIEALIRSGRKIEAIKLMREQTGLGLKEAKDAVERLEAGQSPRLDPDPAAAPPPDTLGVSPEVAALARSGQKIAAIKLLREQTGLGLKEAKDRVDALPASGASPSTTPTASTTVVPPDVTTRRGCLAVPAAAALLLLLLTAAASIPHQSPSPAAPAPVCPTRSGSR